jgi:hypothetical protein
VRKLYLAAVAAALAIGGFAAFAIANSGQQGTSLDFTFSKTGKNKPTGSNTVLVPAKRDTKGTSDESDDHLNAPAKSVIKFQEGSNVNTGAKPKCKETPSDVATGRAQCPNKTSIGSGVADAVAGQPDEGGGTEIISTIKAFNVKSGIMFVVDPCTDGTGPGTSNDCVPIPAARIVLIGTWSKVNTRPTLAVPTPAALKGRVIITRFQLKTKLINSKNKGAYVTTPDVCKKGKWTTISEETYEDGSKQTLKDTQKC